MAKLYYFDGRGRGEIVRLTLAAAGVKFTEELLTEREQLLKLINEGKCLYGQVPVLEIDGKAITQSGAIVRYLARKAGLFGKNEDETVLIDQYYEGGRDFFTVGLPIGYQPEADVLENVKKTALPKYLPVFEKVAAKNGTGYLVGDSLTIADVSVIEALLVYVEYLGEGILAAYPSLQKFYRTVTTNDRIAAFLKGPQRKRKNDERYVSDVKKVLAFN